MSGGEGLSGRPKRERVGGPARGYKWKDFEPGHTLSVTHGAYSLVLVPRAEEIAALIRQQLDDDDVQRFALLISTAAATGAKAEAALLAMGDPDDPVTAERLSKDASRWVRVWLSALASLGLTPTSARAAANDIGLKRLAEHITATYAEGAVEGEATDA